MNSLPVKPDAEKVLKSLDYIYSPLLEIFEDFSGVKAKEDVYSFILIASSTHADIARHGKISQAALKPKKVESTLYKEGLAVDMNATAHNYGAQLALNYLSNYGEQVLAIHNKYKANQLTDEQFYVKYQSELPSLWKFLGSTWGADLGEFLSSTSCTEADIIGCTSKFKHDLFGFIAVHLMDEIENDWPNYLPDDQCDFTAYDVMAFGGKFD